MPKCDFDKVARQLFWNHTSAWVFSVKFPPCFHTYFPKNTWNAASASINFCDLVNTSAQVQPYRRDADILEQPKLLIDGIYGTNYSRMDQVKFVEDSL